MLAQPGECSGSNRAMGILFVSNFYPPLGPGGYEQLCAEVAGELAGRGHDVTVLTLCTGPTDHGRGDGPISVHRVLHPEVVGGVLDTALRLRRRADLERETLSSVRRILGATHPQAAVIWGMWNVPRSVPALLERLLGDRVAYYLCDYWLSLPSAYQQKFEEPATRKLCSLPKRLVAMPAVAYLSAQPAPRLRLERPLCVSQAVREGLIARGVPVEHGRVIHNGIRIEDFPFHVRNYPEQPGSCLRLLYAGRVTPHKGVHTAIEALALLASRGVETVKLDILGGGERHYEQHLLDLVRRYGLASRVSFRGSVARSAMPAVLAEYHMLLFPSEWDEPLPRMPMEAMASGLVVIGTTNGGTGELLVEGETALTFAPGDAPELARQIERLSGDPALGTRLAHAGRQLIEQGFSFSQMVDQLEAVLHDMVHY
jgi:glycosyltransferase involved in cell wall biosynthesis